MSPREHCDEILRLIDSVLAEPKFEHLPMPDPPGTTRLDIIASVLAGEEVPA